MTEITRQPPEARGCGESAAVVGNQQRVVIDTDTAHQRGKILGRGHRVASTGLTRGACQIIIQVQVVGASNMTLGVGCQARFGGEGVEATVAHDDLVSVGDHGSQLSYSDDRCITHVFFSCLFAITRALIEGQAGFRWQLRRLFCGSTAGR